VSALRTTVTCESGSAYVGATARGCDTYIHSVSGLRATAAAVAAAAVCSLKLSLLSLLQPDSALRTTTADATMEATGVTKSLLHWHVLQQLNAAQQQLESVKSTHTTTATAY
jgi:hypothetical protein